MPTFISILNGTDRRTFAAPPVINEDERTMYFNLPQWATEFISTLWAPSSIIGLVLMMGYCRAANKFIGSDKYHKTDVDFEAKVFGFKNSQVKIARY